jgi:hypothetical protein
MGGESKLVTRPVIFRIRKSSEDERSVESQTPDTTADERAAAPSPAVEAADALDDRARMLLRPLKTQLSSSDARTDRLVRQLHAEIESIRSTLGELSDGHPDLLELDAGAVAADPAAAATLPPPLLVRAIIRLEHERQVLAEEAREKGNLLRALNDQHQSLELKEATVRARLETLEEVIAALHANLEDLRYSRTLADHRPPQLQQPADDGRSFGD